MPQNSSFNEIKKVIFAELLKSEPYPMLLDAKFIEMHGNAARPASQRKLYNFIDQMRAWDHEHEVGGKQKSELIKAQIDLYAATVIQLKSCGLISFDIDNSVVPSQQGKFNNCRLTENGRHEVKIASPDFGDFWGSLSSAGPTVDIKLFKNWLFNMFSQLRERWKK